VADEPDKESKTEEATEKKIRDSIDKGQVPFAREVPAFASFLAILTFMLFFAQPSGAHLGMFLATFMERADEWRLGTAHDAVILQRAVFLEIAKVLGTLMFLLMLAGISASVLQNVPRFVLERVKPKLSRISLKKGWSRLFGKKGLVEFAKSIGKILVVGGILIYAMREAQDRLLAGMLTHPMAFTGVIRDIGVEIVVTIAAVMVIIAGADLLWSRFHWREELRMTRQEVKDEIKQNDGDPIVKARMRSLQRDRARQRMIQAVPQATLVIANPTHYAIALRYVRAENAAPVVVAKGKDLVALKIREVAEEHGIPVFEEVELARSMYDQVKIDGMIPAQFYQAVAELVRTIYARTAQPSPGMSRT
jgi:flagellar biosynthesis protein FlhB